MRPPAWNLLITCDPGHEHAAREHARAALQALGLGVRFRADAGPGTLEARVDADPRDVVHQIEELARRDPRALGHTHHWRPVDAWVPSDLRSLRREVGAVAQGIGPWEAWRLTVQVHRAAGPTAHDLVEPLSEAVAHGVVRMHDPDKVLRVDVVGEAAGIALLEPGDDLSVDRVRAEGFHLQQEP